MEKHQSTTREDYRSNLSVAQLLFLKLCIYSVIFLQLQTSLQKYFGPTGLKLWSIFLGKTLIMKWNFCLGDLGGYEIAYQPPTGPHFRPRALPGPWAKMGTLGRLVCNSISTRVTQAEITHFSWYLKYSASKIYRGTFFLAVTICANLHDHKSALRMTTMTGFKWFFYICQTLKCRLQNF